MIPKIPAAGPITGLDLELTAAGASFLEMTTEPASGWSYQISADRQHLAWSWSAFSLPGAARKLFNFCIAGSVTETTGLAIAWRSGPTTVRTDTLELSCTTCTELESLVALCGETGALRYEFRYRNASTFRVDHLRILKPGGNFDSIGYVKIVITEPPHRAVGARFGWSSTSGLNR